MRGKVKNYLFSYFGVAFLFVLGITFSISISISFRLSIPCSSIFTFCAFGSPSPILVPSSSLPQFFGHFPLGLSLTPCVALEFDVILFGNHKSSSLLL